MCAQPARTIDAEVGLAYDRSGGSNEGRLYMVYTDEQPNESDNTDIHLRFSDDDGATWSQPYQIDTVGGAYPGLAELEDGSILAVYYEEGKASSIRQAVLTVGPTVELRSLEER